MSDRIVVCVTCKIYIHEGDTREADFIGFHRSRRGHLVISMPEERCRGDWEEYDSTEEQQYRKDGRYTNRFVVHDQKEVGKNVRILRDRLSKVQDESKV